MNGWLWGHDVVKEKWKKLKTDQRETASILDLNCETKQRKPNLKWSWAVRRGKLSQTYHWLELFADPNRKTPTLLPQQEEDFLLAQQQPNQWETVTNHPMKRHYVSNSQVTPRDFLFGTALPNSPLFSVKEGSSLLFFGLAYGSP